MPMIAGVPRMRESSNSEAFSLCSFIRACTHESEQGNLRPDVRLVPDSGAEADIAGGPGVTTGLMQCRKPCGRSQGACSFGGDIRIFATVGV